MLVSVLLVLHILFTAIWVGGMVFAFMVLRPAVDQQPPENKLTILAAIFKRFFVYVWHAVVLMPLTGYALLMMLHNGFAGAGIHLHIMQTLWLVMTAVFLTMFFGPYKPFKKAVADEDWPTAAKHLPKIRALIFTNLILGILTIVIGSGGRYWV